jgi:predicted RNA polymerase sigma factor
VGSPAVAVVHGPAMALAALEDVDLPGSRHPGRTAGPAWAQRGAGAAYDEAIALATNETERAFLQTRRNRLDSGTR